MLKSAIARNGDEIVSPKNVLRLATHSSSATTAAANNRRR
jgi:hypothetical protein